MSNAKRIKGISIARPIVYGNVAVLIPPEERTSEHTHRWTVAVRSAASPEPSSAPHDHLSEDKQATKTDVVQQFGGLDDISYFIKRVSFKLHDTYPNPNRNVDKPPFELTETGWGEFEIQIKIFFVSESGEKPVTINHHLKLHPWPVTLTAGPNNLVEPTPPPPEAAVQAVEGQAEYTEQAVDGETKDAEAKAEQTDSTAMDVDAPSQPVDPPAEATEATQPVTETTELPTTTDATTETTENKEEGDTTVTEAEMPPPPTQLVFSPVHSWQYDEIVFNEPTEAFYATLVSFNLTPLPAQPRLPKPSERLPIGSGGAIGELTLATEALEARRLDEARKQVLIQLEKMRTRLIEGERGLQEARRELMVEQ